LSRDAVLLVGGVDAKQEEGYRDLSKCLFYFKL